MTEPGESKGKLLFTEIPVMIIETGMSEGGGGASSVQRLQTVLLTSPEDVFDSMCDSSCLI